MRTETRDDVLMVLEVGRLTADTVVVFRELVRVTLTPQHRFVEVDLSQTPTMDSEGVGALIAIYKKVRERGGSVRLLRPTPFVSQLVQLLRLEHVLTLVD